MDWEDILQCKDKISISNHLIKNLACKFTAVMSYHESVQMAAHFDHILYPDLPIQKFVNAAFEQIYHVCPTITIIASDAIFKSLTNMETIMREEFKNENTTSPASENGDRVSGTSFLYLSSPRKAPQNSSQ